MDGLPDHLTSAPVGRSPMPKEVLEGHQRARVLDAAAAVFAARGYNATTVDHLVAGAHIGVGSFYAMFEGKNDCFLALHDRVLSRARERISAASTVEEAPWSERFRAGLRELLALVAEDPDSARMVVVEALAAGPEGEARYAATLDEVVSILANARSLDPRGEELPASFERATAAGFAWLLYERLAAGEGIDADGLLPEMLRIVLEPFG